MKLYLYCFAEGLDRLHKSPRGVSGARVRVVKIDGLSVLVSACTGDVSLQLRKNALAHNAVVRSVFKQTTPLPFRFGAIVTDQQLRNYISTNKQALKNRLAHVRGCAEMNVRIIGTRRNAPPQPEAEPRHQVGPGTKFLMRKRLDFHSHEWRSATTSELSAWLGDEVNGLIRDQMGSLVPSEKVVLAKLDHLVERSDVEKYREKMAEAIERRPDLRVMVSGPWPPYSFANIELEFNRQFGVS